MISLRCTILLQFVTTFAFGQVVQQSKPPRVPEQSEAIVRRLYRVVVARHPLGIPKGEDMTILAPYLSKALLHRIDVARTCYDDWIRQHPDPNLKPPFG